MKKYLIYLPLIIYFIIMIFLPQSVTLVNIKYFGQIYFSNIINTYPIVIGIIIIYSILIYFTYINNGNKVQYFTALFTLFIIMGSLPQFYNMVIQSNADFLLKIRSTLYDREINKLIIKNIDDYYDCIDYPKAECKYNLLLKDENGIETTTDEDTKEGIGYSNDSSQEVTGWELDEYLLLFEYVGALVDDGTLTINKIDDLFGWFITRTWKHPEVQSYVIKYREKKSPDLYKNFIGLANKLIRIEDETKYKEIEKAFNGSIIFKQPKNIKDNLFPKDRSYEIRNKNNKNVMLISERDFERYGKEDIITSIRTKLN